MELEVLEPIESGIWWPMNLRNFFVFVGKKPMNLRLIYLWLVTTDHTHWQAFKVLHLSWHDIFFNLLSPPVGLNVR